MIHNRLTMRCSAVVATLIGAMLLATLCSSACALHSKSRRHHRPTQSYGAAYNHLGSSIGAAHDMNWIVDRYNDNSPGPGPNDAFVVHIFDQEKSIGEYENIGSLIYGSYRSLRIRYGLPVAASDCWVLVLDAQSNEVVRADANGAHDVR